MSASLPHTVRTRISGLRHDIGPHPSPHTQLETILGSFPSLVHDALAASLPAHLQSAVHALTNLEAWVAILISDHKTLTCMRRLRRSCIRLCNALTKEGRSKNALLPKEVVRFAQHLQSSIVPSQAAVVSLASALEALVNWEKQATRRATRGIQRTRIVAITAESIAIIGELLVALAMSILIEQTLVALLRLFIQTWATLVAALAVFLLERFVVHPRLRIDERRDDMLRRLAHMLLDEMQDILMAQTSQLSMSLASLSQPIPPAPQPFSTTLCP